MLFTKVNYSQVWSIIAPWFQSWAKTPKKKRIGVFIIYIRGLWSWRCIIFCRFVKDPVCNVQKGFSLGLKLLFGNCKGSVCAPVLKKREKERLSFLSCGPHLLCHWGLTSTLLAIIICTRGGTARVCLEIFHEPFFGLSSNTPFGNSLISRRSPNKLDEHELRVLNAFAFFFTNWVRGSCQK